MSATVSDVLDLDIHGLAIEVWPGVERIVRMRFPVDTDLSDDWTFTVPHAIGDAYAIDGNVGESGDEDAEGPRPQVSFTLPPERMRDIMRRPFVIAVAGVPKISGPIRVANIQATPGETTVSITLVEPQAIDVSLTVASGSAADVGAASLEQLVDLSGVGDTPEDRETARGNLGLGDLAVKSAIEGADITEGVIEVGKLAPALATRVISTARALGSDTRTTTAGGNDPELKFDGAANTYYLVDMQVQLSGDPTIDAKVGLGAPTGSTCLLVVNFFATNIAAASGAEQRAVVSALDLAGTINVGIIASPGITATITGWVLTGSTPGEIALWWRPGNTGTVVRHANSYLKHWTP